MKNKRILLTVIVLAQFCCTSLWFAGNGVINELIITFQLPEGSLGHLTAAVQLGFIMGTLLFALLTISDRFSPSLVFMGCALLGAGFNVSILWEEHTLWSLLFLRFMTGFFLAGIYPVGMKIAADYFDKGLGKSLGFLVGALVLGTAFPHFLKTLTVGFSWEYVIWITTALATLGGTCLYLLVPDGPYRKRSQAVDLLAFFKVFTNPSFRSAAFGYFGHMWELYAFWAFVPLLLSTYQEHHPVTAQWNIPLLSFSIIGIGGIACVIGGYIASVIGTQRTALIALISSGVCCLLSPFMLQVPSGSIFILYLFIWGMTVVADSPLFSTLVANNAPTATKGTALTIVNCIGFAITIVSIQWLNYLKEEGMITYGFAFLAIGPLLGVVALRRGNV
ncbi:MFS transporter [Algivirga pacifica]|uniref:MFS transporter n=1 Tax=Algivirga pacifica TaxID=1162670 RepID=A0ABP9D6F6_9BACT